VVAHGGAKAGNRKISKLNFILIIIIIISSSSNSSSSNSSTTALGGLWLPQIKFYTVE
jgi:hypothetical protein